MQSEVLVKIQALVTIYSPQRLCQTSSICMALQHNRINIAKSGSRGTTHESGASRPFNSKDISWHLQLDGMKVFNQRNVGSSEAQNCVAQPAILSTSCAHVVGIMSSMMIKGCGAVRQMWSVKVGRESRAVTTTRICFVGHHQTANSRFSDLSFRVVQSKGHCGPTS